MGVVCLQHTTICHLCRARRSPSAWRETVFYRCFSNVYSACDGGSRPAAAKSQSDQGPACRPAQSRLEKAPDDAAEKLMLCFHGASANLSDGDGEEQKLAPRQAEDPGDWSRGVAMIVKTFANCCRWAPRSCWRSATVFLPSEASACSAVPAVRNGVRVVNIVCAPGDAAVAPFQTTNPFRTAVASTR